MTQEELVKLLSEATASGVKIALDEMTEKSNEMLENTTKRFEDALKSNQEVELKKYEGIFAGAKTLTSEGKKSLEPGIKFARLAKANMVAKMDGRKATEVLEEMYAFDKAFIEETKQISVSGDGGYLVEEDYLRELIPLLYSGTAVIQLGARILPMPNGNLNIPKLIEGTDAVYVGENKKKNAKNPKYANVKLSAKKLVAKVVMSNDVLRSSDLSSDVYVRDDLIMQMQLKIDFTAMFSKGGDCSPRGIEHTPGVQKPAASEGLPTTTNVVNPVQAVEGANSNMNKPGWIFNTTFKYLLFNLTDGNGVFIFRDEIQRGQFLGYPYRISNQIPVGTTGNKTTKVFFGDFSEWLIGEQMSLELKVSEEATYADENGDNQSAFDNDQTVMKGMMIHDMAASHGEVFAVWTFDTIAP